MKKCEEEIINKKLDHVKELLKRAQLQEQQAMADRLRVEGALQIMNELVGELKNDSKIKN